MTWQTEMTPILRFLINDLDSSNYTYADSRLQQSLLVGAQLVSTELTFNKSYEINVAASSLTPDPTTAPRDDSFINLVCLKSAVIIYGGELRLAGGKSMKVVDGPSQIDTSAMYGNYSKLYQSAMEAYNRARVNYVAGNSIGGQCVSTPFTYPENTINPTIWNNPRW